MALGPVATFQARSITLGQDINAQGTLSKFKQLFSAKDQLCVYNPATHQHIASGARRPDVQRLTLLDTSKALGGADLQTAQRILTAAGIPHGHLAPVDTIKLALMAMTEPQKASDTAALLAVNANLRPTPTMSPEFIHNLANIAQNNPALALQLHTLHGTSNGTTVSTQSVAKMAEIAQHSPVLAGKLATLGQTEAGGGPNPGVTNYMTDRAAKDPFMADHPSGLNPVTLPNQAALGFEPKFHVTLDATTFANVSTALTRLQHDGILTDMQLDPNTNTVHCGYTYQTISDMGVGVQQGYRPDGVTSEALDVDAIKTAFRNAANQKPGTGGIQSAGLKLEKAFGNPTYSAERQQTRFDAVMDMFTNYEHFDYTAFDADFTTAEMNRLDNTFAGQNDQQRINQLLNTEGFDGFAISENHGDTSSKRFIYNNLANMYQSGVRVLAIEHLKDAEFQRLIDDYMQTPAGTPMGADLAAALKGIDRGHVGADSFTGIVQKIHDDPNCRGIRLIGADTENNNLPEDDVHKYEVRMGAMNTVAEKLLQAELQPGEKFVILAGKAHNNTHVGLTHGMPGFAQTLGVPPVTITANGPNFNMVIDREDQTKRTGATLQRPQ